MQTHVIEYFANFNPEIELSVNQSEVEIVTNSSDWSIQCNSLIELIDCLSVASDGVDFEEFLTKQSGFGVLALNGILPNCPGLRYNALYFFLVNIQRNTDGSITIKFWNYIKHTKLIAQIFGKNLNFLEKLTNATSFDLQEKSLYFAFASLKHISSIIPFVEIENVNVMKYVLQKFHATRPSKINRSWQNYSTQFKRYVDRDKERQNMELGIFSKVFSSEYNCIPFSKLKSNVFLNLLER